MKQLQTISGETLMSTVTASHSASQDLPALGEPAKMCKP